MYKNCEVIMLATKENSSIAKETEGLLKFIGTEKSSYVNSEYHICQHLCFLSDDEINSGISLIIDAVAQSHDWSKNNNSIHSIGIIKNKFLIKWIEENFNKINNKKQ